MTDYPSELERDVVSDGYLRYHVRPIRPDDAPRFVAFHNHLLPRSVFLRFFTFHTELSPKEVEHFTCVDYVNRLALVAEIEDRLIAVGRYDSAPGETEAEVAFVVADEFQHHGIGALLLDELARAAWEDGVSPRFVRRPSVRIARCLMCSVTRDFRSLRAVEYGTVILHFPIEPTDSYVRPSPSGNLRANGRSSDHATAQNAGEP